MLTRMKILREQKGESQMEVARALDLTQGEISQIERGYLEPRDEVKKTLSEYFGFAFNDLMQQPVVQFPPPKGE